MDLENLGPAPDLDNIDLSTMDRGDNLSSEETQVENEQKEAPAPVETEHKEAAQTEHKEAAQTEHKEASTEPEEKKDPSEEQPRDAGGKFAKKEDKGVTIPKSRFDEAVNKEREAREAAEARAAEAERRLAERQQRADATLVREEEIRKLDKANDDLASQHAKLLLDGDAEGAAAVMREIRHNERSIARLEAQATAREQADHAMEYDRLQVAISTLESAHPVLNPKSEKYDDDVVQTVLMWQQRFMSNGASPSQAITEAAEKVLNNFYRETTAAEVETETEAETEKDKGLAASEVVKKTEERTQKALEKALEADKQQAPAPSSVGLDSDKMGAKALPDVSKMSADEYDALPETTKARLRGDLV